jgi:hypothetical protein
MLTIVTGTPGAGKTLFSLDRILREFRSSDTENQDRPIFINGVPGIDYDFFGADELENPEKWFDCPEGSVIFIDEGQRIFPQRPASAAVPKKCREFETHRHKGFDVIVTTQDANTLDVHLRRLCGRHFHVKRTLGQELAAVIEYDHYQKDPNEYLNKREAITQFSWKYNKKLYERYKSAEVHTVKKRYPFKLFLIPIALVFVIGMVWLGVSTLSGEVEDIKKSDSVQDLTNVRQILTNSRPDLPGDPWSMHKPRIPGLLHTAPFYDDLWKAETFPRPNCVLYQINHDARFDSGCMCHTQQGTKYETDYSTCRYWALNGWFDPTLEEDRERGEIEPYAQAGSISRHSGRME